jgi:hypothetical protein
MENIKLHLKKQDVMGVDWIHLVQDSIQLHNSVNTTMNLKFYERREIYLIAVWLSAFQKGLCSMKLISHTMTIS